MSYVEMATRKNTPQTIVLDPTQAEEFDDFNTQDYVDETSTYAEDADASLCPSCGEPLAWHDEACSAPATPTAAAEEPVPDAEADPEPSFTPSRFAYTIGQPVQPAYNTHPHTIIWRGQVKERHPRTGLLYRVNVYRLDNGYWDCYFEAELQAA
ncbi:hypothetical protein [Hymenobacter cavernae]|uniref:Uncharacterized protein n=1 Tax=Hymenobacter cavernae TaxID=2044852 RepID=A0ABQ1UHR0_9BACT|nr:hypothetical protein [Hymenobacter cavernae]GGF18923.1 hypothetical protein GCM10011383_33030 [Hymenobacter cavernae]